MVMRWYLWLGLGAGVLVFACAMVWRAVKRLFVFFWSGGVE